MPSTISAGTTAGTAIAVAGDTTGNLAFQTNGTTTAMTIDTSQRVGVGTATPQRKVTIVGPDGATGQTEGNSRTSLFLDNAGANYLSIYTNTSSNGGIFFSDNGNNNGGVVYETSIDDLYFIANAAERMRLTSTGALQFNSGYGSVATAYGCRSWVNFNGTGTPAIRGAGNVSSISDNGTGDYTVNYTTSLVDANYSVVSMGGRNPDGSGGERQAWNYADRYSTTSVRIQVTQTSGSGFDQPSMFVSVFR